MNRRSSLSRDSGCNATCADRIIFGHEAVDIDAYITGKALDALFVKIGEEEKLSRQNPAARTTELLRKVFGAIWRGAEAG